MEKRMLETAPGLALTASEGQVGRVGARSKRRRWLLLVAPLGIGLGLVVLWADRFLVVNAPLERADAIVIPLGGLPYRAMTAGEIYRAGYARRVIVSRPATEDPRLPLFRRFGLDRTEDDETAARILAGYGVPQSAIRVSVTEELGTGSELRAVSRLLRREGWRSVILVTDPLHTRRAYLYMSTQGGGDLRVIPRASASPYGLEPWWRNTEEFEAVLHEYLGLVAFAYHWLTGDLTAEPAR
jgi:uncharacterized SAM-binding protein YcdF (DUF218 family)